MRVLRHLSFALTFAVALAHSPTAQAYSSYYSTNCAGCHGSTVTTCNGCHSHGTHSGTTKGSINLAATVDKTSYAPGDTVSVTLTGGYRNGWVRAVLFDQSGREIARSSCPGGMGGCSTSVLPVTLTAPAPATAGSYSWAIAWYGNQYDASGASFGSGTSSTIQAGAFTPDPNNPNHGYQTVAVPAFTVTEAAVPSIALNPATLNFGNVTAGGSASLTAQVRNTGTAPLHVTAITRCASPATSTEFSWSPAAPFTVAVGGSTTMTVTYAPTGAGADSGCIAFSSDDAAKPTVSLDVSGTGQLPAAPKIAVSATSLAFGNVTVGASSARTFTISNSGNAALTGTVARAAATSGEYTVSPSSFSVAAGGSQTVTVTYAPTDTTTDSGSVVVSSNDPATPSVSVGVSGTGVPAPTPAIALSPASLSFGTVTVGSSTSLTAQIRNAGNAPLSVSGIALCSGTSSAFSWAPLAPISVAPGAAATLTVSYRPSAIGTDSGCLALSSNDPASPTVSLGVTGTAAAQAIPAIALDPASLGFGTVSVGSSATQTARVQNTGNATLNVTGVSLCSGTPAAFTWSPTDGFSVAPGESADLTVSYAPSSATTDTGCIAVASNDPSRPSVTLSVTGAGSQPPVPSVDADVDILSLKVAGRFKCDVRPLAPKAVLKNVSAADGTVSATLKGLLGEEQVYDNTVEVTLPAGGQDEVVFPSYVPPVSAQGATVYWTLTVQDQDPDSDEATARTIVAYRPSCGEGVISRTLIGVFGSEDTSAGGCSSGAGGAGMLTLLGLGLLAARRRARDASRAKE